LTIDFNAQNDPKPRSQFATIVPFVFILAVLAGLSLWELKLQDSGRVVLTGQNLWANAQKRATFCLLNYSVTHADPDLQCFKSEIDVVLGDMQSRRELDSRQPSHSIIADGFVRGRNHRPNVFTTIALYKLARWSKEIEKAIQTWRDSDPHILRLVAIAGQLQNSSSPPNATKLHQEISDIDLALSKQGRDFTTHLDNGMHSIGICLIVVQGATALVLILLALLVSRRMIAAREVAQQQVHFLAYYDALTGLPNRTLLNSRIASALAESRAAWKKVGVLFLDVDHFKVINDSLGHSVGDTLLKEIAQRLKQHVRECDTIARVGGDKFVIVVAQLDDAAHANRAADRILQAIAAGFTIHGVALNVACSIGISLFPDNSADSEKLIRDAEAAMCSAKACGRNRLRFFAEEMNAGVVERMIIESSLHLALKRQELYLDYQPQVEIATGRVTGVEALVRWRNPEWGRVLPDEFIEIAENSGLILPIGEWVIKTACKQARAWQDQGLPPIPVAVNVSVAQFRQDGFCDQVRAVLRETRLAPHLLDLELTESLLLTNEDAVFHVLDELHSMGVNLTIDDFGTGYSSLSYLRQIPVSKIKIDQSFIRDVPQNASDAGIATAIISMAKHLKLKVIAEGVETREQLSFLRAQHCDEIQGFYLSKPMSASEFPYRLPALQIQMGAYEMAAGGYLQ
jgi:diguanylate cyclase (GGDEF)-like protein